MRSRLLNEALAVAILALATAAAAPSADQEAAIQDRTHKFEWSLWMPTPPGKPTQYKQRPAAEQRPLVEAFFKTLVTPAEKIAFLHVGDSRYLYAIDRMLYGEYAAKLLKDADATVRREALRGLSYNQLRDYGAAIEPMLDDPDVEVRGQALRILGQFGRHDLLPRMAGLVERSPDAGVRITALDAIGRLLRDKDATPVQRERALAVIAMYLGADADLKLQQVALIALGNMPKTAEAARHVDAVVRLTTAADAKVREAAVTALTRFEGDAAAAAIRRALSDGTAEVRGHAARAVAARKDTGAADRVVKLLDDEQPWVRVAALEALAAIDDRAHAAAIAGLLSDANTSVRRAAVEALETLEAKALAGQIVPVLKDGDETTRLLAVRALGKLGTREQAAAVAALAADKYYPTRMWVMRALDAFDARDQRAVVEGLTRDPEAGVAHEAKQLLEKWDKR